MQVDFSSNRCISNLQKKYFSLVTQREGMTSQKSYLCVTDPFKPYVSLAQ